MHTCIALLAALALVACNVPIDAPTPASEETCLPYAGAYEAPALPEGACSWQARVSDGSALVLLVRGAPACGTSIIGECRLDGCGASWGVSPGDIVDVWGTPPDPRVVVSFIPQACR